MKVRYVFISMVVMLAMISGCGNVADPDRGEVAVVFTDDGFELTSAHVYVSDYQQGKRADITFFITNNTGGDIKAEVAKVFNVTPEKDSTLEGKGYVAVPAYYADWIKIPMTGDIAPGRAARYTAALEVPNDTPEEVPDKWAFVVVLASNTGGFTQVAGGVWVVVDMR